MKNLRNEIKKEIEKKGYKHVTIKINKNIIIIDNLGVYVDCASSLLTRIGIKNLYITDSMAQII